MRRRTLVVVLLALAGPFAAGPPLHAQQPPVRQVQGGVLLNFQDADLAFVLSALAQAAGVSFLYSDLPEKPVTLRTVDPLNAAQLLGLMRTLANANGISITEEGGVLRLLGSAQFEGLPEDPRQLYIYKLSHARAPVLAATLQSLFGGGGSTISSFQQAQTLTAQLRGLNVQTQQRPQIVVRSGGGGDNELTPFGAVVVPDEVTNSLLIRASPLDWEVMQEAIQALDLRPLQVVIEVVIAEVRRRDDTNIGLAINADGSSGDGTTVGDLPSGAGEQDFTLRIIRTGDIDIEATLSALSSTGDVRILSRPVIHAQNNQQASITVGTERPFVQVSRIGVPGTIPEDVIQYRDVATTLIIVPTINEEGYVNMAVTQTINNATAETQFGAPVISKREAITQILARTGQTVVVGGLIDRQTDRTRSGIPFLKDIPVLGYLFGSTRENISNSELFLFLTPHVVVSDEDAQRLKDALESNVELLQPLVPIEPLIPPLDRPFPVDTLPRVPLPPDTIPPVRVIPPDAIPAVQGIRPDNNPAVRM